MSIENINATLARQLLNTFNHPVSGVSENYKPTPNNDWKGAFISTRDFFDKPHVSGAYLYGNEDYPTFYIEWQGFEDIEDSEIWNDGGYDFVDNETPTNWHDTVRIVKRHLKEIIDAETNYTP